MPTFEVVQNPEVVRLVRFSTGLLNPEAKNEIDFKCYSDQSNKRKLAVTTKINNIEYSGQNFGQRTFSAESCDYYVAVQRKGADKVQILPAELFNLHPKMEDEKGRSSSDCELDGKKDSMTEKTNSLTVQFGSGKSQKKVRKAFEQRMDDKAIELMSQSVPATSTSSASSTIEGDSSNTVESTVILPHNKDAEKPEDVYLLETIIPDTVMDSLREQSQVFVKCTTDEIANWKKEKKYPSLILKQLEDLPLSSVEREWKCSLIMYLHCLMYTYNLKTYALQGSHFPGYWKLMVMKLLDDRFTFRSKDTKGRVRRTRPLYLKDLLLSHIIILNLRLNNYTYPLQPLIEELKLNLKRTVLHATTLGLNVSGKADKVVKLQTPFKLPPPSIKKKSRR